MRNGMTLFYVTTSFSSCRTRYFVSYFIYDTKCNIAPKTIIADFFLSFSFSCSRNFVFYFIHDTLWAYSSVTRLKNPLLLTCPFHTLGIPCPV